MANLEIVPQIIEMNMYPSHSNQIRKRNKRYPNWKGGSETVSICRCRDTLYIQNPKVST